MKRFVLVLICCLFMVSVAGAQDVLKDATSAAKEKAISTAKEETTAMVDDSTLTADVKVKLMKAPSLKGSTIEVSTTDGVVTLTGEVKTKQAKGAATKIAKAVKGVKDVDNQLTIAKPVKKTKKAAEKK
jgi:hyperosmotically inducible periplasmic protein